MTRSIAVAARCWIAAWALVLVASLLANAAAAAGFEFAATPGSFRGSHTATALPSGKVLVAGGFVFGLPVATAEIYDPVANAWTNAPSMAAARQDHTATLLPSGKVLVVGGYDASFNQNSTAELYDPATNLWSSAGSTAVPHYLHTATLLPSGKVLVAGGDSAAAEIYDPATNAWSSGGSMSSSRFEHTATLLPSGKVLVAAGYANAFSRSAELYDPATNNWTATGQLATGRILQRSTLLSTGKVLLCGGFDGVNTSYASCEIYDPATAGWAPTGAMTDGRHSFSMTLLPSGLVLATGGLGTNGIELGSAELFDPVAGSWSSGGTLNNARYVHSATLLPTGRVLITSTTAEIYDPTVSAMHSAQALAGARSRHSATLLPSGTVLVVGGSGVVGVGMTAELYNESTGVWTGATAPPHTHAVHSATLLGSGKVLVAGGGTTFADLYDPAGGAWSAAGSLSLARSLFSATLLPSGKVLVAGGFDPGSNPTATVEIYDPGSNAWTAGAAMATARAGHRATLLPSGKVLVTGGTDANDSVSSCELYDPASNRWFAAAPMATAREAHTATLLPSGKLLVVAGLGAGGNYESSAELYDPAVDAWSAAGSVATGRNNATATLLPSGQVLIAGGINSAGAIADVELYDPVANTWSNAAPLATARYRFTSTLLPSGVVLNAGGVDDSSSALASTELFDAGLTPVDPAIAPASRRPVLSGVSASLFQNGQLGATGSGFMPASEGSDGATNNSATNTPVFEVQRLDNEQMRFIANDETVSFSGSNFTAAPAALAGFPPGPILVRVWVNGVPGVALSSVLLTSGFVSLDPARILDTRPGQSTVDHLFEGQGALGAQAQLALDVLGRGGVAASGVDAVVVNVTVTAPTGTGFVTVWPAGQARPTASNLNFAPGDSVSNLVIVKVGAGGQVALFNSAGSTDLVADVVGYFTSGSDLASFAPARLLDTRVGRTTVDGLFAGQGALAAQTTLDLPIAGRGTGIVPASGAGAAILNVTATSPTANGFVTVWPTGGTRPTASTLNYVPGQTIPNLVIGKLGNGGSVSLFNSQGTTDLIVDVTGWLPTTSDLTPLVPARVLDTRAGRTTIDGIDQGTGVLPARTTFDLQVAGRGGVPAGASGAVILNVTVTSPAAQGFLVAWPSSAARPKTSNINFNAGQTIANLVIARIGANGKISLFANADTDLVVDVVGYFSGGP